tara:strand:- start:2731 stop:2919 length:189 start_codon:yes stop_codon:yes gene_type:complete
MKKTTPIFRIMLFLFTITFMSCGDANKTDVFSDTKEVCEESVKKECCVTEETDTTIHETITK